MMGEELSGDGRIDRVRDYQQEQERGVVLLLRRDVGGLLYKICPQDRRSNPDPISAHFQIVHDECEDPADAQNDLMVAVHLREERKIIKDYVKELRQCSVESQVGKNNYPWR